MTGPESTLRVTRLSVVRDSEICSVACGADRPGRSG